MVIRYVHNKCQDQDEGFTMGVDVAGTVESRVQATGGRNEMGELDATSEWRL